MAKHFLFKIAAVVLGALLLSSCGPVYKTTYTYKGPKSFRGKRCVNRCLRNRSFCQSDCNSTYEQCVRDANRAARPAYQAYVRERKRAHQPIWKKIDSFADYSRCTQNCGCQSTYHQCYSNCGGKIISHRVCVAFCDKAKKK